MWSRRPRPATPWRGNTVPRSRRGRDRLSWGLTAWLAALWVMVFGHLTWVTLFSGILVALAVQWFFPLPHTSSTWHVRPFALIALVVRFIWDVIRAGLQVSWVVLSGRHVRSAILRVNLHSADPVHLTAISAMTSLVPGTIVVRVDRLAGTVYLHVLDVDSQGGLEAVRSSVLSQERRILAAIGSNEDLRAANMTPPSDRLWGRMWSRAGRRGTTGPSPERGAAGPRPQGAGWNDPRRDDEADDETRGSR